MIRNDMRIVCYGDFLGLIGKMVQREGIKRRRRKKKKKKKKKKKHIYMIYRLYTMIISSCFPP